ncbi:MAG: hypothetical protein ABIZ91_18820, partial [Gemmatimonadaceae bacterium]
TTYATLQTPRARDTGLFRRVLAGLSCREYEAAAEAVPEAFGLAKSSVSRPFIRNSARAVQQHEPLGVVMPPLPFRDPVTLDAMCPSE